MASDLSGCVLVPLERLRALEALEASLPELLAKTKAERDKERLLELHAKAKADPKAHSKTVLAKYHKNKVEINARRREAYKAKKLANESAGTA